MRAYVYERDACACRQASWGRSARMHGPGGVPGQAARSQPPAATRSRRTVVAMVAEPTTRVPS